MSGEERRTVKVDVFKGDDIDEDWPTRNSGLLTDALAWFERKLNEIPEQYRAEAKCQIEAAPLDWENYCARIEIWYDRPETDKEYESRMAEDARRKERVRQLQERTVHTRDMRGEAKLTVRGLGPGLEEMRKRGLTE